MAGLFFCLASAEGAGLLFCPAAMHPYTSVYSEFCAVHATYRTCRKTAYRALQRLFLRFAPFNRPQYQADTSSYNTVCDTLGRITAPHCLQRIQGYHHHAGRCTAQHSRPIIIMYIRARPCYGSMPDCAAYCRPCQPGGVSMLPTPGG